jgi:hypothetical protein
MPGAGTARFVSGIEDPDAFAAAALRLIAEQPAGQLKKLVTAVANSGEADVARFW